VIEFLRCPHIFSSCTALETSASQGLWVPGYIYTYIYIYVYIRTTGGTSAPRKASVYTMAPHIEASLSFPSGIRTQDSVVRAIEGRSTRHQPPGTSFCIRKFKPVTGLPAIRHKYEYNLLKYDDHTICFSLVRHIKFL
jgi:hypothetical protein